MKLLLVEDELTIIFTLKMGFEEEGYEVEVAFDGKMGQHLALQNSYDVILLDISLPYLNGYELCEQIRRRDATVPILMLTTLGTTDNKVGHRRNGELITSTILTLFILPLIFERTHRGGSTPVPVRPEEEALVYST